MVFVTLAQKAGSIEPGLVGPWLYRTAANVSHGVSRKRDRRKKHESRSATEKSELYEPQDSDEVVELVQNHLMLLDEGSRDALMLRYIHGQGVPEIAAKLQISSEAAKKRLQRGLDRLRKAMAENGVVASIAITESALRGIGNGVLPPGFINRLIENLRSQGLFGSGNSGASARYRKNLSIVIGSAVAAGILGSGIIWWINAGSGVVARAQIPQATLPPTIDQRVKKRFSPFETQSNLSGVLAMLKLRTGEQFDVQWDALEAIGINRGKAVGGVFQNMTLGEALTQILDSVSSEPGSLQYIVEPDRIVINVRSADTSRPSANKKN